jgi:peptidyl-prolyl cis-trans isomerase A (cyclophilin A)
MRRTACFLLFSLSCAMVACEKSPPEIVGKDPKGGGEPGTTVQPVTGPIALATATADVPGQGQLVADLETDKGKLTCKLFEDKAPKAVANFVGLARGLQPFQDPVSGTWVKRRAYDMAVFHRIIKGFMIQGGDPSGTGTGDPGYTFADEKWGGAHDRAGLLCMANKGPNTNGMQWFITDAAAPWLDDSYTIFGECAPLEVVHAIASVPVAGEKPQVKPVIKTVNIRREPAPAASASSAAPSPSASASASAKPSASAPPKK